jgi:hypothetical protein
MTKGLLGRTSCCYTKRTRMILLLTIPTFQCQTKVVNSEMRSRPGFFPRLVELNRQFQVFPFVLKRLNYETKTTTKGFWELQAAFGAG